MKIWKVYNITCVSNVFTLCNSSSFLSFWLNKSYHKYKYLSKFSGLKSVDRPLLILHLFEILLGATCLQRPVKPARMKREIREEEEERLEER